ncbi:hybrid sensor histidine kinase/response regulator [Wolinella succinogenes]|uniref:hybrid sensor histidine kinase/response regulator n=1 Tax=Wolinella succinogenes TaxID=844 RepID=UPI00240A5E63|nr:response regulator [Wolinella succinogenes]
METSKRLRILYVEDDALIREATLPVLERFALEVFSAQNGEEALKLFREKRPNIIITDIRMPVMDGLAMARLIKAESPYVPIIFVSAHNDTDQLMEAIDLGADAFLVKPFSLQKLREILRKFDRYIAEQEETKRSQRLLEEYKKAVDASAILSISDLSGNIIFANDKLCEITGYTREELLGHPHSMFRHPDTPKEVFERLWSTILEGKIWKGMLKNRKKSGEPYYVDATVVPLMDENNQITQFLGLRYEITSLIRAQNALRVALKRAEEADRVKGVFLANMSHEMRTPLNGIIGFGRLLLEENLSQEQREYVEIIDKSGEHLLGIINDILDLSKIESGKFELESLPMKLSEELRAVADFCEVKAREKGVKLLCLFKEIEGLIIKGDVMRLKQVTANLLGNAIKFTPEGGEVRLGVEVLEEREEAITLDFSVSDTGIGIAPEYLEKIFRPFEQAESSTARNYGGTGLGLSISQELVRLMGGEMRCQSEEGKGSRFSFTLTLPKAKGLAQAEREIPKEAFFNGKVLVAEDNLTNQKLVRILLEKLGLSVVMADDGVMALEHYAKESFDLVFLDIQMPLMDGWETKRRLREVQESQNRRVPLVVLSANAMSSDRAKYVEEGFDACLTKPLIKEELIEVLMRYLPLQSSSLALALDLAESSSKENPRRQKMANRLGLDEESFLELEREFVSYAGHDVEALLLEIERGGKANFERAHAIKGAALNLGFDSLAEILGEIEQLAREGAPVGVAVKKILQEAWKQTKEEVEGDS